MKIIGLVGMPGSGKSEAADVARRMGIPVLVMGDVIREEAARLGLEPTDENLGNIGDQLRESEGPAAVAERCMQHLARALEIEDINHLKEALACKKGSVVVEGIRSREEVEHFRGYCRDFNLVEVFVPPEIRLKRMANRRRTDDPKSVREGRDKLVGRDLRELGWGMSEAIREADVRISNEGDLGDLKKHVERLLVEIIK